VQENVLLDGKIPQRLTAVVNLVDLAGSERAKRAGTLQNSTQVCTYDHAQSASDNLVMETWTLDT